MDLFNRTPVPAAFLNTVVSEDYLLGAVVIKASFQCLGWELRPDPEHAWPIGGEPVKTPFGELDGETPFLREGVDLIVLGNAYPRDAQGMFAMVEVRAGGLTYDILVVGDRRWIVSAEGGLVSSAPEPFSSMPLTWERAFGGKAKVEAGEMPYAANPVGRGFYMSASAAEGGSLPNLEDPAEPVRSWDHQVEPRSPAPYSREWAMRAARAADFDMTGAVPRVARIRPSYFNNANPRLVLQGAPAPGEVITVSGVRPGGAGLSFSMPDFALHVYVQLQDRPYVFPVHLESILVLAEEERVVLGYKCVFRYRMVPLERRAAVLLSGPAPAEPPEGYLIPWDELAEEA